MRLLSAGLSRKAAVLWDQADSVIFVFDVNPDILLTVKILSLNAVAMIMLMMIIRISVVGLQYFTVPKNCKYLVKNQKPTGN